MEKQNEFSGLNIQSREKMELIKAKKRTPRSQTKGSYQKEFSDLCFSNQQQIYGFNQHRLLLRLMVTCISIVNDVLIYLPFW